jgi:hypothetical protein
MVLVDAFVERHRVLDREEHHRKISTKIARREAFGVNR